MKQSEQLNLLCKICNSRTQVIYDKQFDITYYYCGHCEFITMDEKKQVSFNEERRIYDLHNNSLECEGYVTMFHNFLENSVIPFKKEGKALDFGSGPEPVLSQLIIRDYKFDIDHYDLHYQPDNTYKNTKYDVIFTTEVIEHLKNPIEIFKMLYEILNEDGILAVMTLFHDNNEQSFIKWWYRRDETHISFYTIKTLKTIAKLVGFSIIYTDDKRACTLRKKST